MWLRQELATVAAPPPAAAAAAAAAAAEESPPPAPPEWKGKQPDLKKRKQNDEQQPTPLVPDATSAVVAADQHDAADQPQPAVLSESAAGGAEDGTLCKHVTDASSSDNESKHGSNKRKADQVTADGEPDSRAVQDMGLPPRGSAMTIILATRRKKKLPILDLNGLLADINQDKPNAHLSHGKFRGKLVFKRPHCDDFLRFCIHHFELGIWSSRLRANVDAVVNILMKDLKHHLLFCWDLSKCTGTGLNTLENKVKPLVLKELKKLWDKEEPDLPWQQGQFSPSNTLLVDDSPYKALRNPPHTAIFPCPYSYKNDKDDALGPGGELRLYLDSLATADDVQSYVREHPFGQPPITDTDPDWNFYRQILYH